MLGQSYQTATPQSIPPALLEAFPSAAEQPFTRPPSPWAQRLLAGHTRNAPALRFASVSERRAWRTYTRAVRRFIADVRRLNQRNQRKGCGRPAARRAAVRRSPSPARSRSSPTEDGSSSSQGEEDAARRCRCCGTPLVAARSHARYCSPRCRKRVSRGRETSGEAVAFVDGEAYEQGYALLQVLLPGEPLITLERLDGRLRSEEILAALVRLPVRFLFGYGLNYDITYWLADLPLSCIRELRDLTVTRWGPYRIDYVPDKFLRIQHEEKEIYVFDLLPFFQRSFVSALREWGIPYDPIIEEYKARRGTFTAHPDEAQKVRAYNEAELAALASLFDAFRRAVDEAGYRPAFWSGPGAIAACALERHGVKASLPSPRDVLAAEKEEGNFWHAASLAYYGGRFELRMTGVFPAVWEYDLASAYPHAIARGLPCFAKDHGAWQEYPPDRTPTGDEYALLYVSWQPREGRTPVWGPFPVRASGHVLVFPLSGTGWYHACEVAAAMRALGSDYTIRIHGGWWYVQTCTCRPCAWVRDLADERVRVKHSQPGKAQVLKLVLNSLYGKFADRAGVEQVPYDPARHPNVFPEDIREEREPPFYNPFHAGLITARTRARLLEAIGLAPEAVIYVATDAVHAQAPLPLPTKAELGAWEALDPARAVFLNVGIYAYEDERKKRVKQRGLDADLGFAEYVEMYHRLLQERAVDVTERGHFVGLFEALARSRESEERYRRLVASWEGRTKRVTLDLSPRRLRDERSGRWLPPPEAGCTEREDEHGED